MLFKLIFIRNGSFCLNLLCFMSSFQIIFCVRCDIFSSFFMISCLTVLWQVIAGCWRPSHVWVSTRTWWRRSYLQARVSRRQKATAAYFASTSGCSANGKKWSSTTVCRLSTVVWSSCIRPTKTSSGRRWWRKLMPSTILIWSCTKRPIRLNLTQLPVDCWVETARESEL